MSRYIDADKLKSQFLKDYDILTDIIREQNSNSAIIGVSEFIGNTINSIPTADVQEVKHGKYIGEQQYGDCVMQHCSQCGYLVYVDDYCGHCGAKMDRKD